MEARSKKEHFCMHNPQREEGIKMTPQKKTRHVRFSSLEIVELPYTIGDNPCVSDGCPVAASWLSQKKTEFDIDFFERHRPARRSRKALLLSAIDRNALLIQSGHTAREIMHATFEVSRTRNERFETSNRIRQLYKAFAMQQATESVLALKKKQRRPTLLQQRCLANEIPDIPVRVFSPLSSQNTEDMPLKRRKRMGTIQHPGLYPVVHGNGAIMMVPPRRVLSPPRTDYRKTPLSS